MNLEKDSKNPTIFNLSARATSHLEKQPFNNEQLVRKRPDPGTNLTQKDLILESNVHKYVSFYIAFRYFTVVMAMK